MSETSTRDDVVETPRQAFELCVGRMKEGAAPFSFEEKFLKALEKHGLPEFEEHSGNWPGAKSRVMAASHAIGKIAAGLAEVENPDGKMIMYPQARDAVAIVKQKCQVGFGPKGVFCPDLPAEA